MSTIYEDFLSILKKFDENINTVINQYSIEDQLKQAIPNGAHLTMEELAELIAFTLVDQFNGSESGFGNYFAPPVSWIGDDGKAQTSPSLGQINPEVLAYWEKRLSQVKHPFLIARYSGLVWDLSQVVLGKSASHDLRKKFVQASLAIIKNHLFKDSLSASYLLERTVDIVSKFNDKEFFSQIKELVDELQRQYDIEGRPRYCVFSFDIFTKYKKLEATEKEINDRIEKMEECLTALCTPNADGKTDPWAAESIVGRLGDFYAKRNDKINLKRVVLMIGQAYEPIFTNASNFQVAGWLQSIYKMYKHYALNEEAEKIALRMREVSAKSTDEIGIMSHTFEIPKDKIEETVNTIYQGTDDEIFAKIIYNLIPDKESLKSSLLDFAKEAPLQFMVSTQLQDHKGRPIANVGNLENDIEGQLVLRISEKLKFDAIFLHFILQGGIDRSFLDPQSIIKFLSQSAIIDRNRLPIIERALKAYFDGDNLVFIHLVIPQIEEAIRNMIERNGGNVQKYKNGVFNLRTFDDILRDPIAENVMGHDLQTYLRILFTDARGLNLRNEVCHGMIQFELFDKQTADRVLHGLLCLGMIRIVEDEK